MLFYPIWSISPLVLLNDIAFALPFMMKMTISLRIGEDVDLKLFELEVEEDEDRWLALIVLIFYCFSTQISKIYWVIVI